MKELRRTIIVASLAAALLRLEALLPLGHADAALACATPTGVAAQG